MRALFLADAHLRQPSEPNYRAILDFLHGQSGRLDLLVLLGDIFEFWAGDRKQLHASYQPLYETLEAQVKGGTQLVYVEGNHDFDLGRQFTGRLGCRVIPDGGTLDLEGRRIYLAHGDLANPADRGYLLLRRLLRSLPVRTLIRHLPISLVLGVARISSRQSRNGTARRQDGQAVGDILAAYGRQKLAAGHEVVITGHFHQPLRQRLAEGELIALGDWIEQYSYLWYENGEFTLKHYQEG